MGKNTIQITVPADLAYSAMIRHVADEIFAMVNFNKAWCSRLKLIVDELYMNAVKYGSTEFTSFVYATFEYDDKEVSFSIEDDGTGPMAVSPEQLLSIIERNEQNTDYTRTSGRGLSMITKVWADKMEVKAGEHGGIAVSIVKKIETSAPPAPLPPTGFVQQALDNPYISKTQITETKPVVSSDAPVYEIQLQGEIDKSNIEDIVAPINDKVNSMPDGCILVLDFTGVTYINSTFIGNLAAWYTIIHKKGGTVRLKNINEQITEILDLVGLLNVFETNN